MRLRAVCAPIKYFLLNPESPPIFFFWKLNSSFAVGFIASQHTPRRVYCSTCGSLVYHTTDTPKLKRLSLWEISLLSLEKGRGQQNSSPTLEGRGRKDSGNGVVEGLNPKEKRKINRDGGHDYINVCSVYYSSAWGSIESNQSSITFS